MIHTSELAKREVRNKIRIVMQPGWVLTNERFEQICEHLAPLVQLSTEAVRAPQVSGKGLTHISGTSELFV